MPELHNGLVGKVEEAIVGKVENSAVRRSRRIMAFRSLRA